MFVLSVKQWKICQRIENTHRNWYKILHVEITDSKVNIICLKFWRDLTLLDTCMETNKASYSMGQMIWLFVDSYIFFLFENVKSSYRVFATIYRSRALDTYAKAISNAYSVRVLYIETIGSGHRAWWTI